MVLESIAEWLREASFVEVWNVEAVSQEHAFIVQPHIIEVRVIRHLAACGD